jgi:predicted nucleic-acid-binding protein
MKIVDANVVLRYLLADVPYLFKKSENLIENEAVSLPFEVLAEIVFVLEKVYVVSREEISESLGNLLKYRNISTNDNDIAVQALRAYSESNLDFIDTLLFAYHKVKNVEVVSFDRKLNSYIKTKGK